MNTIQKKVLILDIDIFDKTGGGQTSYQRIIQQNTNCHFYYFSTRKTKTQLPNNVTLVPIYSTIGHITKNAVLGSECCFLKYCIRACNTLAYSIKKHFKTQPLYFDIVDTPDYYYHGACVKEVFEENNIKFNYLVLALHGRIGQSDPLYDSVHSMQKNCVDYMYSFSEFYFKQQYFTESTKIKFINPFSLYPDGICLDKELKAELKPNLMFIGRHEYQKGLDIFIDLIGWIDKQLYDRVIIIGPEEGNSAYTAKTMASRRNISIEIIGKVSFEVLKNKYLKAPNLLIVPSRVDTLNLVAIEALLNNVPTIISDTIGLAYLAKEYTLNLPLEVVNFNCSKSAVKKIEYTLSNYSKVFNKISSQVKKLHISGYYSLREVYDNFNLHDVNGKCLYDYKVIVANCFLRSKLQFLLPFKIQHKLALSLLRYSAIVKSKAKNFLKKKNYNNALYLHRAKNIANDFILTNNSFVAVCYVARFIRYSLDITSLKKNFVKRVLRSKNLPIEAEIIDLFYSNPALQFNFLKDRFKHFKNILIPENYKFIDDKRTKNKYKVSVITSLYNAKTKIFNFIQSLAMNSNSFELVLIESGSETEDYEEFLRAIKTTNIEYIYACTSNRETIQAAWNRGISLSTGDFLVFLGCDEGIHPKCLEILSQELDDNPGVDWVIADSIVSEVDNNGVFIKDVNKYDRSSLRHYSQYLDTCYLNYVGGMYRKSIHMKYGYYDPSFNAAGDTEFKNRILKHINIKHVSLPLGQFFNYPESRSSMGHRTEIEDLRAWYLFRTEGGLRYVLENKSVQYMQSFLYECLKYRKSYCGHFSTDLYTAKHIAKIIYDTTQDFVYKILYNDLSQIVTILHAIATSKFSIYLYPIYLLKLKYYSAKHKKLLKLDYYPSYNILNDNFFEQHVSVLS